MSHPPQPNPREMNQRLAALRRQVLQSASADRAAGRPSLARAQDVSTAVEEMRVMQEELLAQNQELLHTYEELARERQRYRELFDFAPDPYLVTSAAGMITDANRSAAAVLGLSHRLLLNKPLFTFIDPRDRQRFRAEVQSLHKGPDVRRTALRIRPRHKGAPIDAELAAAIERDARGAVVSVRWLIRDVTRVTAANEQLKEFHRRLQALAAEVSTAQERERRRIAVEIHDRISQTLAMARLKVAALQKSASPDVQKRLKGEFGEVLELLDQSLEDTRTLTFELSPPILYELGLTAALEWLAEQVTKRHKLKVVVDSTLPPAALHDDLRVLLFHGVNELLVNVVKHAKGSAVRVSLREAGETLRLTVADDGQGFGPAVASAGADGADGQAGPERQRTSGGFGLFSLRTRLQEVGGSLEISSIPDHGTRVTLVAPLTTTSNRAGEENHGNANPAS